MVNLVLHCGARHVERRAVEEAPTPAASQTWVPIAHHRLLEQVEETLTASGMTVANEAHALWTDGLRYFGLLEIANGQSHDDYGLVIGLRNSARQVVSGGDRDGQQRLLLRQSRVFERGDDLAPAYTVHRARPAAHRPYGGGPPGRHARPAGSSASARIKRRSSRTPWPMTW